MKYKQVEGAFKTGNIFRMEWLDLKHTLTNKNIRKKVEDMVLIRISRIITIRGDS